MKPSEVIDLLVTEGFDYATDWRSNQLVHMIGEDYIRRKYQDQGSGYPFEFDDLDIRRAVVSCRLRSVLGIPSNPPSRDVHDSLLNVAQRYDRGFAVHSDGVTTWVAFTEDIDMSLLRTGLIVVSCWVGSLSTDIATLVEEADED